MDQSAWNKVCARVIMRIVGFMMLVGLVFMVVS
jgi:hypothetical protein